MDTDIHSLFQQLLTPLATPSAEPRLIRLVALPGSTAESLLPQLVLEGFDGREGVCEDFRFEATALSPSADLNLAPLLGQPLGLELIQASGAPRRWYGLVTEVGALGSDGGLARFRRPPAFSSGGV